MQRDNEDMDDLEYLSQLGFEKVPVSDGAIRELVKKTRTASFSYNNGIYFWMISLLAGVFIGISLFFVMDHDAAAPKALASAPIVSDTTVIEKQTAPLILDTLTVMHDNFVAPHAKLSQPKTASRELPFETAMDSAISIPERPVDISLLRKEPLAEAQLKFIANAPVVYIHDLKITNYTLLYFKNSRFVKLHERRGISAEYANRQLAAQEGPTIKQSADYFLHEELAQALLQFKKGNYDPCIQSLNTIAGYNDNHDLNCDFYRAMCYYYKRQYAKAIGLFDACTANINNTFLQEATYYKAVALFDSGNKAEAISLFKQIAGEDSFYSEKAKGYLF